MSFEDSNEVIKADELEKLNYVTKDYLITCLNEQDYKMEIKIMKTQQEIDKSWSEFKDSVNSDISSINNTIIGTGIGLLVAFLGIIFVVDQMQDSAFSTGYDVKDVIGKDIEGKLKATVEKQQQSMDQILKTLEELKSNSNKPNS